MLKDTQYLLFVSRKEINAAHLYFSKANNYFSRLKYGNTPTKHCCHKEEEEEEKSSKTAKV